MAFILSYHLPEDDLVTSLSTLVRKVSGNYNVLWKYAIYLHTYWPGWLGGFGGTSTLRNLKD